MLEIPLTLLALHFVADFVLQSDWMAINKSKNNWALTDHALVYSLPFLIFYGFDFAIVTFVLHWLQDYVTSRINAKLWQANQRHWFFVGIGADQLLHYILLALTLRIT